VACISDEACAPERGLQSLCEKQNGPLIHFEGGRVRAGA
jgi:hypothetical protein